jgi:hypothetical protein
MLKTICLFAGIIILVVATTVSSETFEEFQKEQKDGIKAQQREYKDYDKESAREFANFQREQKEAFAAWNAEYKTALKSGLRRIKLPDSKNKGRASVYDIDYGKSHIQVKALGAGKTKELAVKNAQRNARLTLNDALTKGDPSIKLSDTDIKDITATSLSNDKVSVKKTTKGYIAESQVEQSFKAVLPSAIEDKVEQSESSSTPVKTKYTSLIIDAKGLGFKACLIPVVESHSGEQLYGPKLVNKESAVNGMAVWVAGNENPAANPKAGSAPLKIRASTVRDKRYLRLDNKESELVAMLMNSEVIKDCKVIITVD